MKNRNSSVVGQTLQRLVRAPETANRIYELAESLYLRGETAERLSLGEIDQIKNYLHQTEIDGKRMKKQFHDLAEIESGYSLSKIPVGF